MIYLGNGMYSDAGGYLQHHGVKGQKWGVRNGPPYPIEKDHITRDRNINKSNKDNMDEIFQTMSKQDKERLWPDYDGKSPFWGEDQYFSGGSNENINPYHQRNGKNMPYSVVYSKDGKPISFLVVGEYEEKNGKKTGEVGLGVRGESEYRGKGHAKQMAKRMTDWFDKQNRLDEIYWYALEDNVGSWKAAKSAGFGEANTDKKGWKFLYLNKSRDYYDPPYSAKEVKANYGKELYDKLSKDPAHKWRMNTGYELIHKEPSKQELKRIMQNWEKMPIVLQDISDSKSIELFGVDNRTHYKQLLKEY